MDVIGGNSVDNVLSSVSLYENDYLKSQTAFTTYYPGFGFYGTFSDISTSTMYKGRFSPARTLVVTGQPLVLPIQIGLNSGWNFVPCPFQTSTALVDAMPTHSYAQDDLIKSQSDFSTYYTGYGWHGNLQFVEPGLGYKLKVGTSGSVSYTSAAGRRRLDTSSAF